MQPRPTNLIALGAARHLAQPPGRRSFTDDRPAEVARTSAEGVALLARGGHIDELWLDHDLGGDDRRRWGYDVRPVAGAPAVGYR